MTILDSTIEYSIYIVLCFNYAFPIKTPIKHSKGQDIDMCFKKWLKKQRESMNIKICYLNEY